MSTKKSTAFGAGSVWKSRVANNLTEALARGVPVYASKGLCENGHQSVIRVADGKCAACTTTTAKPSPSSREIEKNRLRLADRLAERDLARELKEVWHMPANKRPLAACILCGADDVPLGAVGEEWLCEPCEEFERMFDIDSHEAEKRAAIAEQNEY